MASDTSGPSDLNSPPRAAPEQAPLDYASPDLRITEPPRRDYFPLLLAVAQATLATMSLVSYVIDTGHQEINSTNFWYWLAWRTLDMQCLCVGWLITSILAIIGSMRPIERRYKWYLACVLFWLASVGAVMVSLIILAHANISERWVSTIGGTPVPAAWQSVRFGPEAFGEFLVLFLVVNPVLILLLYRALRARLGTEH